MNNEQGGLLELVKMGMTGECLFSSTLYDSDWKKLFDIACQQGVASVAWRGIEVLYKHDVNECPQDVKLQWYARCSQAENLVQSKMSEAVNFAKLMLPSKLAVLKGFDYARYWPKAEWREYGDLDCFAIDGNVSAVDKRAEEAGCKVDYEDYKHAHISYHNIMVENHHFFTAFGGSKQGKALEEELRRLFEKGGFTEIGETGLYSPNLEFTAVFILAHAQNHFFYEGMSLRQILDWHFFLQKEGGNVDWEQVEDVLERTKLKVFAVLLTQICKKHFGLCFDRFGTVSSVDDELVAKFLDNIFREAGERQESKVVKLLNRYGRFLQFRELNKMSVLTAIWRTIAFSSYMHRNPELN